MFGSWECVPNWSVTILVRISTMYKQDLVSTLSKPSLIWLGLV